MRRSIERYSRDSTRRTTASVSRIRAATALERISRSLVSPVFIFHVGWITVLTSVAMGTTLHILQQFVFVYCTFGIHYATSLQLGTTSTRYARYCSETIVVPKLFHMVSEIHKVPVENQLLLHRERLVKKSVSLSGLPKMQLCPWYIAKGKGGGKNGPHPPPQPGIQWNLRTKDTLGTGLLSFVRRLSLSRRFNCMILK